MAKNQKKSEMREMRDEHLADRGFATGETPAAAPAAKKPEKTEGDKK
jgi:hypothetical protein